MINVHNVGNSIQDRFLGSLLGMAIGDARGLPYEGLSKQRLYRLYPKRDKYHFLFGCGLCSDDTEHAFMTAQALLHSTGTKPDQQSDAFIRNLAWRLRFWFLGLPAGIGKATFRSIVKLFLGFSPDKSGVYSAGNGPAMRAPVIGLWAQNTDQLKELIHLSTIITHSDPEAEKGALLIGWTAYYCKQTGNMDLSGFDEALDKSGLIDDPFLSEQWQRIKSSLQSKQSTEAFAAEIGCADRVSGYMWHTVPVVLHAFLLNSDDYEGGINSVINCGGDTDTTAAILGGLIGIIVGEEGIPQFWKDGLIEWPGTINRMKDLAMRLGHAQSTNTTVSPISFLPLLWLGIFIRNILFLIIEVFHCIRRLSPFY